MGGNNKKNKFKAIRKKTGTDRPKRKESKGKPKNITIGLLQLLHDSSIDGPVSLDCEMVGVGERMRSALARISIVDYFGNVLYDVTCRPEDEITDYRTPWSGIRPSDMHRALPYVVVREQVLRIVTNRVIVGHMLHNDFKVLDFIHPKHLVRDTGTSPYAKLKAGLPPKGPVALRQLANILLGMVIQTGEHCSIEDAQVTMCIYRLVEKEWEEGLRRQVVVTEQRRKQLKNHSMPSIDVVHHVPNSKIPQEPQTLMPNSSSSSSLILFEDTYWLEEDGA